MWYIFKSSYISPYLTVFEVPGIGFSDDPLLQGRNFSYFDTQITRLGINWEQVGILSLGVVYLFTSP
jgi:catalase